MSYVNFQLKNPTSTPVQTNAIQFNSPAQDKALSDIFIHNTSVYMEGTVEIS